MKKSFWFTILLLHFLYTATADDLADILQDLAIQTACIGMYSTAQTGVYVTSRYDDPPDYYDPPMMANRFAAMSGNRSRTITFYGVCFDYAQFAWNDINDYQELYNKAGMKGTEWYIAVANVGDPNTIILYDPTSQDKATIISNGVYLKEKSRHKVRTHDGATGHAWLWVQHKNGTWYWIDPTWTDNTGYPWWGKVEKGKEVQYYPDPAYCVARNYPSPETAPSIADNRSGNQSSSRSSSSSSSRPSSPRQSSPSYSRFDDYFLFGYSYTNELPFGITIGSSYLYASANFGVGGTVGVDDSSISFLNQEGQYWVIEWIAGTSWPLGNYFLVPIGLGANHSGPDDDKTHKFVMEIGIQPVIGVFYLSATYRLIGLKKSGFTLGAGFVL